MMCWFLWDATIFCNNFARWLQKIVATWCVGFLDAMIFCNNFARWLQKIVAALRFVGFYGMLWSFVTTLCSPNEDFGRPNQHFRVRFRSTFQGCEYRIWASKRWKVLRKRILKCWFGLPTSSFGRGNIARMGLQKHNQHMNASMIVWCFLCNNIARMGLQNTINMRDACEQSDAFFVTILQGWVYKTQPTCEMHWCMDDRLMFSL